MNRIYVTSGIVPIETESVKRYMTEIKKPKMLTREQEGSATRDQLIESNLRFVVQVAKQYQGMGLELEDLIAFGNLGLFEAADRWDEKRNIKFITFAVWYIRAEITKALNDMSRTVRIPSHKTSTEAYSTISTHATYGEDDDKETYADRYLEAPSHVTDRELMDLRNSINMALSMLKPKEAAAVRMFYGIDLEYASCMDDIADKLNVSNERARQLVRAGEIALRKLSGIKILQEYL
jgi:RNA polymerase primary sigma factor